MTETYAALITRDGLLSVYEPVDHDDLATWKVMMQKYVCPTPPRQEETGFKVCFHKEKMPCWTSIDAGLDKNALSLAVAAMNIVKVYRTDHNRIFYQAAELSGARNIIRDVAWANGSMRGFDIIRYRQQGRRCPHLRTPCSRKPEAAPRTCQPSSYNHSWRLRPSHREAKRTIWNRCWPCWNGVGRKSSRTMSGALAGSGTRSKGSQNSTRITAQCGAVAFSQIGRPAIVRYITLL